MNEIYAKGKKNPHGFEKELKEFEKDERVYEFLKKYMVEVIEILIKAFSVEDSLFFMDNKTERCAGIRVLGRLCSELPENRYLMVMSLYQKISQV